jgi:hypothetical protein
MHEIRRINGKKVFQTGRDMFQIGGNKFYNWKNQIPMKIPGVKRNYCGIPQNSNRISQPRMGSSFTSVGSRCPSNSSDLLFSCHSELMAKNITTLMAHPVPMPPLALSPPQWGLRPLNSWATFLNPPSALTLKQFLLHCLLLLIRVLIYSSFCLVFHRLLLSRHPPTSVTILSLLLSL